ncbi:5'-nucleotidase domain-containing protein 1-like isoform X2 [Apostichopus japonicus]|uniref:5'-nucleotidase domain-containing protein 1-like isoform X2 n=1 Tax=Stichopus japonicus TaxID=307972 RepID=UPI003AB77CA7
MNICSRLIHCCRNYHTVRLPLPPRQHCYTRLASLLKSIRRSEKGDFHLNWRAYSTMDSVGSPPLSFSDYDAIGVDLDHTLCKYKLDNLFPHIHESVTQILVDEYNYDKELLEPFYNDRDSCFKGLVFDFKRGNILKLAENGEILRASHGLQMLTDEDIKEVYPEGWQYFSELKETLGQSENYRYFENFFDMPLLVICARIIDMLDRKAGKPLGKYTFITDLFTVCARIWDRSNFSTEKDNFFAGIKRNPEKYLQPCSDKVRNWLKEMKAQGKVIFLLTSSHIDFASFLLDFILGSDWKDYFSICITYARKPGFFMKTPEERPFLSLVGDKEGDPVSSLKSGEYYSQGNVETFHKYLEEVTGKAEPKIMYFGDSLRSDTFPTSKFAHWTNVLILEEMEAEGLGPYPEHQLNGKDEPVAKKPKYEGPSGTEKEFVTSKKWGSFFTHPMGESSSKPSQPTMNTMWGYFIRKYASLAVPQLDYIADLPLDYKFSTFDSDSTGLAGFYPCPPACLTGK